MYAQPVDGSLTPNSFSSPAGGLEAEGTLNAGNLAPSTGDNISRIVPPPWLGEAPAPSTFGEGYGGMGSVQGLFGPLMGMLQQLMQMLQSLMGYGCNAPYGSSSCPPYGNFGAPPSGNFGAPPNGNGGCPPYGNEPCPPYGNERFFQNASGASDGDPHLSFNG